MGQPWVCSSERLVPPMFVALIMKTIITSNSRPLRSALCTLLLGIAALSAMPRSASGQLYIGQANGTVSEYDVSTNPATLINANLIQGLVGAVSPLSFLVVSGNTLFVANGATVGAYNATSGAVINANLITGFGAPPIPLAVSGNTLFVSAELIGSEPSPGVYSYDATTGAAINITEVGLVMTVAGTATVTFAQPFSQIPNVTVGSPLVGVTVVSETTTGFVVNTVDPTTGLPVNATVFWTATGGTGGITGLSTFAPELTASGNTLFVQSDSTVVGAYDATTGAAINPGLITFTGTAPSALAVSGNTLFALFVANNTSVGNNTSTVGAYDATTGAAINPGLITFTGTASALAVSGNTLFLANENGTVSEYDVSTNPATLINANRYTGFS